MSEYEQDKTMAELHAKEPMLRVFALGKINRILKDFAIEDAPSLTQFDKRLLKGFYVNNLEELENDSDKEARVISKVSKLKSGVLKNLKTIGNKRKII